MMRRFFLAPAVGLALLAAAAAQDAGGPLPSPRPLGPGGATAGSSPRSDSRGMYEDIEVMRRLLARQLHVKGQIQCTVCHGGKLGLTSDGGAAGQLVDFSSSMGVTVGDLDHAGHLDLFVANRAHHGALPNVTVEGAYLKGHGVVFTVTMPPTGRDDLTISRPAPAAKPASDWEQVKRQLRGEKPGAPAAAPQRVTLVDALLATLAENGKNFIHLPPNESVTVVVTFRGESGASSGGGLAGASGMMGAMGGGTGSMAGPASGGGPAGMMGSAAGMPSLPGGGGTSPPGPGGSGPVGPMSGGPPGPGGPGDAGPSEPLTADRELELLGDLHLKRNNLAEAASAFERAKKQTRDAGRQRDLAKKLADVYLKTGNLDAARKALELPAAAPETGGGGPMMGGGGMAPAKPTGLRLPGKLILSATRTLLEDLGSGKADVADFPKLGTLEVLTFDGASK